MITTPGSTTPGWAASSSRIPWCRSWGTDTYVRNNPLGYVDPTGHFSEEELLRYGVFYGPRQMAACQADERGCAMWYWALRAAEEGDWLEAWWGFWHGFKSGGMVKARGQFRINEGVLLLTLESGASYRVYYGGLQGLENPEVVAYPMGLTLEKSGGVQLWDVESLRRYVRRIEGGEHPIYEGDYWEGTIGGYFGVGGHLSGKLDRFGRVYVGFSIGLGGGKMGVSVTQGHLMQDYDPDPAQLERVLGGWQVTLQGGAFLGGSVSSVDLGPIPVQYGLTLPLGWAFSFGYSWRLR